MSDVSMKATESQIRQKIKDGWGVPLDFLALADMAEEAGEQEEADALRDAADAMSKVAVARRTKADLRKWLEAKIGEVDMEIRLLRKRCPHPITTYYPDASGNNDSSTVCQACGQEV